MLGDGFFVFQVLGDGRIAPCPLPVCWWWSWKQFSQYAALSFPQLLGCPANIRALTVTRKLIDNFTLHSCWQYIFHSRGKGLLGRKVHSHMNIAERSMHRMLNFLSESCAYLALQWRVKCDQFSFRLGFTGWWFSVFKLAVSLTFLMALLTISEGYPFSLKIRRRLFSSPSRVEGEQILIARDVSDFTRLIFCLLSQKESHLVYKPEKVSFW